MIKIHSLSKIYKSKNRKSYHVLKNIDLTLPDNGLIFLLGKSGSGKSTFLNLIGGLDSATSGEITIDGNDLSILKESELADYRNSYVGFVFQDYCLIDELTVYENISIALEFRGIHNEREIEQVLNVVGLDGYAKKYPSELSGGERQRVAIARAIVKKPHIILADEPTGNLDVDTATIIFDLLKLLSKEILIFVVSHDQKSAHKYADRIIELECGEIVADEINNSDYTEKKLLKKETTFNNKGFEKLYRLYGNRISRIFLKGKFPQIILYSFMVAIIMTVLILAQTITAFDATKIIKEEVKLTKSDCLFLTKTLDTTQKKNIDKLNKVANNFPEITDLDIKAFRDAGYKGNIYSVYKCNLSINQSQISAGMATNVFEDSLYILEPLGIMVVDEEFLKEKYGKLDYIAKAKDFHPTGLIITDYLADIMLHSGQISYANDYDDLIGEYHWGDTNASSFVSRGYINGIIKTGYKEKYKSVFDKVEKYGSDYMEESWDSEDLSRIVDDIHTMYGFCYSLNPNFTKDVLENPSWDMVWHYALRFGEGSLFTTDIPQVRKASSYGLEIGKNEVLMEMTTYNKIFGKQYTVSNIDTFKPHVETLSHYLYSDLNEDDALFTQNVKIVGLFVDNQQDMSGTFLAGDDIYNLFAKTHIYPTGLYFTNSDNIISIIDTATELGFQKNLIVGESLRTMTKVVEIFVPIFRIIAVILCVAIVFILINFNSKMINDKMREIGILKAIGAKNCTIGAIFGVQILLISLLTGILSTLGYLFLVNKTNDLLVNSLQKFVSGKIIPDLAFLTFSIDIVMQNYILIFLLALISYIAPMIKIRALDPVRIIRIKD